MSEHPTDPICARCRKPKSQHPIGWLPFVGNMLICPQTTFTTEPVPEEVGLRAVIYMAESMGMRHTDDDQEQNFILGHLHTFAAQELERASSLAPVASDPRIAHTEGPFPGSFPAARDRVAPPSGVQTLREPEPGWKAHDFDADGPDGQCRRCMTLRHEAIRVNGPECERDETDPRLASPLPRSTEGEALTALVEKWRAEDHWGTMRGFTRRECADELDAFLTARASSPPPPVSPDMEAIGKAQAIARELRCDVTVKRCLDFGCRHEGALDKDNTDYRCPSCLAYSFLLTAWPLVPPSASGPSTEKETGQ